jgi:hypothetical protein
MTAPEDPKITLSQAEIDALFFSAETAAYFDDTCGTPHDVKVPKKRLPVGQHTVRSPWQYAEYRSKADNSPQGWVKWRKTVIEEEEDPHCLWFRDRDGKMYFVEILDPSLLGF